MQGFLHSVWPLRMHFCAIFLLKKTAITRVDNDHTRKKFTLVLNTTYKNVFLKYQVNARFLSLCFVSENFHRRKKEEKKKVGSP